MLMSACNNSESDLLEPKLYFENREYVFSLEDESGVRSFDLSSRLSSMVSSQVDVSYAIADKSVLDEYNTQYGTAYEMFDASNVKLSSATSTIPSGKLGERVSEVRGFREKPDEETAREYIRQGSLWNGGIFAFRLGYLLERAHQLLNFADYQDLYDRYGEQKKISFDYAVVEKEKDIKVLRYQGQWKDLGSWNTFTEGMAAQSIGKVTMDHTCNNTHVINELNIPILCMGCRDLVVAASADGILVSDKEQSSYMKPFVEEIQQQVMYAEKSWGSFTVLDVQEESMTIKVLLRQGNRLHYHSHEHRDEVWTVANGQGRVVLDGVERQVGSGDVIRMSAGCKHTIIADTSLQVIEVQLGREISVEDKQKWKLTGIS